MKKFFYLVDCNLKLETYEVVNESRVFYFVKNVEKPEHSWEAHTTTQVRKEDIGKSMWETSFFVSGLSTTPKKAYKVSLARAKHSLRHHKKEVTKEKNWVKQIEGKIKRC